MKAWKRGRLVDLVQGGDLTAAEEAELKRLVKKARRHMRRGRQAKAALHDDMLADTRRINPGPVPFALRRIEIARRQRKPIKLRREA